MKTNEKRKKDTAIVKSNGNGVEKSYAMYWLTGFWGSTHLEQKRTLGMRNFIVILICLSSALILHAKSLIFSDGDFTYVASTQTYYDYANLLSFNGSTSQVVVPETVTYDSRTLYIRNIYSVFKGNCCFCLLVFIAKIK